MQIEYLVCAASKQRYNINLDEASGNALWKKVMLKIGLFVSAICLLATVFVSFGSNNVAFADERQGSGAAYESQAAQDHEGEIAPQAFDLPNTSLSGKWSHNSKGWWYTYADGSFATGLKKIDNITYFFDAKGWMKTGWQKIDNEWRYFNKSGAMTTGWQKVKGKWYLMSNEGIMLTGKQTVSGKIYFLNDSGAMRTGWIQQGGSWYYCNSSGAVTTGWQKVSGKWYYLNPAENGKMLTGKQTIEGKRYLLNASGAMKTGWSKDEDGNWYYYDKSGAMKTNAWISGTYWVGSDGVMATYSWVDNDRYYVDGNGKWVKNTPYRTGTVNHCIVGRNHSMYKVGFDGTNTHLKCSICGWEQQFKGDLHQSK